jgi:hypothetical protein
LRKRPGRVRRPLQEREQAATLARLRDGWAAEGMQITRFELYGDDRGVVMATNPLDEVQLAVTSTEPPTAVAVIILSACYRPAATSV